MSSPMATESGDLTFQKPVPSKVEGPAAGAAATAPSESPRDAFARTGIVGDSAPMRAVQDRIAKVATSDLPVLIRGETGTGKELVARAIHRASARRDGPFVSENCAALAEGVLEAELFGHEKGSFTGATEGREGLFARANGGTLFIDEIGDMSPGMQGKVLRALQEGEVRRVGGGAPQRVDVRVVAATHRDLDQLAREGHFRQDLLFRLDVLEVRLPSLRERMEDVPLLAQHFLEHVAREGGVADRAKRPLVLSEAALDALLAYHWPGNVRELENAVRVAALFSQGPALEAQALPIPTARSGAAAAAAAAALTKLPEADKRLTYDELRAALDERERRYIRAVLDEENNNKARAARRLCVTRYALYRTLRRLGIELDEAAA